MEKEIIPYGGQAVLEGVMMRGPEEMSMSVRDPEGKIVREKYPLRPLRKRYSVLRLPLLRGVVTLFEALFLGVKTLSRSANLALGEEEEIKPLEMLFTVLAGAGLAILLFVIMPAAIIRLLDPLFSTAIGLNLTEGLIKVAALLIYIGVLNFVPDTRRFFAYHGAEHKVLHTYENKQKLTVENVRAHSPRHPRCGTSFIFLVLLLSVIFFTLIAGRPTFLVRVGTHLALLPLVAGCAYEVLRAAGKPNPNVIIRILSWPGILLQHLTTKEPDDEQIEVAINALEGLVGEQSVKEVTT